MRCDNDLLEGLGGWLNTVAHRFANGYLNWEDMFQEGVVAILKSGTEDEALAKTVAIRAMNKYRKRQGLVRVLGTDRCPLKRTGFDYMAVVYESEPTGIFWDNVQFHLSAEEFEALKLWLESDDSVTELAKKKGVADRTLRHRLGRAFKTLRLRAGVEEARSTYRRQPKRGAELAATT